MPPTAGDHRRHLGSLAAGCFVIYSDPQGVTQTTPGVSQTVPAGTDQTMAGTLALTVGVGSVFLHCGGAGIFAIKNEPQSFSALRVASLTAS